MSGDYTQLQETIDKVIGKIGHKLTKQLLDGFLDHTTVAKDNPETVKRVSQYLVSLAINVFELHQEHFYTSTVRQYRDARTCCFHLLRKYTEDSFSKIGLFFGCDKRTVMYGFQTAENRLSMPQGNPTFHANYKAMESKLLQFLGKI
jgi:chromosomal replication initiation ATPase DnaA